MKVCVVVNETNVTKIMMERYVLNNERSNVTENQMGLYVVERQNVAIVLRSRRNAIKNWKKYSTVKMTASNFITETWKVFADIGKK